MHYSAVLALLALVPATEVRSPNEEALSAAFRGCEEWVLNPASWIDGPAPFIAAVGLGDNMGLVREIDEVSLPPLPLRRGNHYWRINATESTGYVLVVSDQLPMCHITGGGDADLQPVVEAVLASTDFTARWEVLGISETGEMASTSFRNRTDPSLSTIVSRAKVPGARRDRVQVLVTATYED